MALAIATNNAALRAAASASSVNRDMETSMARLSSGKRINSASDDAAGVAISSRLSAEIRGTDQAVRNSLDGQALIDTAEGAHKEIENILQRMREVAVQAANDTNNDQDRANLQAEMNALMAEIDRISSTTTWAGENLMAADGGTDFSFQVGANTSSENQIKVTLDGMSSKALGLEAASAVTDGDFIANGHTNLSTVEDSYVTVTGALAEGASVLQSGTIFVQYAYSGDTPVAFKTYIGEYADNFDNWTDGTDISSFVSITGTKENNIITISAAAGISTEDIIINVEGTQVGDHLYYVYPWMGVQIDIGENHSSSGSAEATLEVAISSTTTGGGVTAADATIVDGKLTPTAGVNSMTLTLGAGAGTPVEITGLAGDQSTSDATIIATAINAGTTGSSIGAGATTTTGVVTSDPSVTTPITVGPEFQVNTNPTSAYPVSSVTGLTDGGFVVTWSGDTDNNGFNGDVLGQRYDASGSTIGLEFTINTTHGLNNSAHHRHPLVTALTDGGFVVTYTGDRDGLSGSILGQRYDSNGAAAGSEFQVSNFTDLGFYLISSVTSLDDGGFLVTWTDNNNGVNGYGDILGQRYDANGAAAGSEFQIGDNTAHNHTPSVTSLVDGGFVVTWIGDNNGSLGISGQRYDANGAAAGSEFQVSNNSRSLWNSVTSLDDGGFVAAWTGDNNGYEDILGQRYDANGAAVGSEFQIGNNTAHDAAPSVTSLVDGGFVVTWMRATGDNYLYEDILGQRFGADAVVIGSEFQVSTNIGNNVEPSVTSLADGDFLVTWAEHDYSGSDVGQVLAQRFDAGISVSSSSSSSSSSQGHGFSAEVGTGTDAGKVILTGPTVAASVSNGDGARKTINAIDNAIKTVNIQRSKLGAVSNRLSHTVNNLTNISSNLSAAQGGIEDADFAKETTDLAKNQILQQASTAMLAQANASKQNVLSLLQG